MIFKLVILALSVALMVRWTERRAMHGAALAPNNGTSGCLHLFAMGALSQELQLQGVAACSSIFRCSPHRPETETAVLERRLPSAQPECAKG